MKALQRGVAALAIAGAVVACNALTSLGDYNEVDCIGPCLGGDVGVGQETGVPPFDSTSFDSTKDTAVDVPPPDSAGDDTPADGMADTTVVDTGPPDVLRSDDAISSDAFDPCKAASGFALCEDFDGTSVGVPVSFGSYCSDPGYSFGTAAIDAAGVEYASPFNSFFVSTSFTTSPPFEACAFKSLVAGGKTTFDLSFDFYLDDFTPTVGSGGARLASMTFTTAYVSAGFDAGGTWSMFVGTTEADAARTSSASGMPPKGRWMHALLHFAFGPPGDAWLEVDGTKVVIPPTVSVGAASASLELRAGLQVQPSMNPVSLHMDNVALVTGP